MNNKDIISEAEIAGFMNWRGPGAYSQGPMNRIKKIVQEVAKRAAVAEREECAKVCEAQENRVVESHPARVTFDPNSMMARKCAAVIRARGQA